MTFQQRLQPLVWLLFAIGVAAIACIEIYAHLWQHTLVLFGYLLLLGSGYWPFLRARREEWEGRYLDYRALAEASRVQFFWRWSGLVQRRRQPIQPPKG